MKMNFQISQVGKLKNQDFLPELPRFSGNLPAIF